MDDLESNLKIEKFYSILRSVDIEIEQEDIFYRSKYNDIINYFKMILTHNENSLLYDYSKIVSPHGLILIKINQNSDINDFLKLISKNYFLDVIELNYEEIFFRTTEFFEYFQEIVQDMISSEKDINSTKINDNNPEEKNLNTSIKKILIIDEGQLHFNLSIPTNLLEVFINSRLNKTNFIENSSLLIWITNKFNNISMNSQKIFDIFDLFINIPPFDSSEREAVLKHFSELFP